MLKNYLTLAWRNIRRNLFSSSINILGLSIGMTCVILILFYVQDELKYDRFFHQAEHIFQVNMSGTNNGEEFMTGNTAPEVGPAMINEIPEIESYVRIYRPGDKMVEQPGQTHNSFTERRIMAVDSNFLQVFDFELKAGNPSSCLEGLNALVITEQTAIKYFGQENPMGKILLFENERTPFVITGVLKDLPSQSSFQFDMLVPISAYAVVKKRSWNWFWLQVSTYLKLKEQLASDKLNIERIEKNSHP